jgi:hypothetical protein
LTRIDPEELPNPALPENTAVIVLFPGARRLLFRVRVPVAVPPAPVRIAPPRYAVPSPNETTPVGEAVPLAARSVAVRTVVVERCMPGVAEMVKVVAVTGTDTVTLSDALDGAKFPAGT